MCLLVFFGFKGNLSICCFCFLGKLSRFHSSIVPKPRWEHFPGARPAAAQLGGFQPLGKLGRLVCPWIRSRKKSTDQENGGSLNIMTFFSWYMGNQPENINQSFPHFYSGTLARNGHSFRLASCEEMGRTPFRSCLRCWTSSQRLRDGEC